MNRLDILLFGFYPYFALAVFVLGGLLRYEQRRITWRPGAGLPPFRPVGLLLQASLILLLLVHIFGLLLPPEVHQSLGLSESAKQVLSVALGGVFGGLCVFGLAVLVRRRLSDPSAGESSGADIAVLLLVGLQLLLGLLTVPASLRPGSGGELAALAEWAQRIASFRPGAAELLADVGWLFKLHLLFGLTLFLVFPFSRVGRVWTVPIGLGWRPRRTGGRRG